MAGAADFPEVDAIPLNKAAAIFSRSVSSLGFGGADGDDDEILIFASVVVDVPPTAGAAPVDFSVVGAPAPLLLGAPVGGAMAAADCEGRGGMFFPHTLTTSLVLSSWLPWWYIPPRGTELAVAAETVVALTTMGL